MVANSDIQIWQDAVKGINETGKADLNKEEWSALTVLNGCLSSGNFSSEESRSSYKTLKDSINQHVGNPALQKSLYDFISLCYKYATAQPVTEALNNPTAKEKLPIKQNQPTPNENKQSITLKNILFGSKGAFSKNLKFAAVCLLVAVALAGIIYALNAGTSMSGYVTALVIGTLASISLLRKNQNGKIREKLAFAGAAIAGIFMYSRYGQQISGSSAFVWTFLGVGLVLSFVGKNKPKWTVWFAEVIPATLCFLAFERLGGAISGFGAKDMVLGYLASVRYVEAFKIFLLFCLFQSFANNAVVTQYRERVCSKWKDILFYGVQTTIVLLLLCVSLNPFKLPIFDSVKSELIAFSQPVRVSAEVFDANGKTLGSAEKTPISSALLCEHIPGYLATAYDFHYDGSFDTARITFEYDAGLGKVSDRFQPRIYYFNEIDGTLEELPNQIVYADYNGGWSSVSAKTAHFSIYILLNSVEYNKVWTAEIRRPAETDLCSCGSSATVPTHLVNFDVVFVIDESGSMNQNDPNRLRVEAAKQFIDMLAEDSKNNRAAIYGFENWSRYILNLTALNDKEAVKASLNSIHSGGGTNIYSGLQAAVQEIEANNNSYTPVIILMTDGQDNSTLTNYTPLIDRANAKGITVFAIGLGKDVNSVLLRQICDNTGGGVYYYAESSDVLPSIFKSANAAIIDYEKDSNGDGISDYYAQLLSDGTLRLSNGSAQFKGIDWVNCPADLDGDGLKNGEELVITGKIVNGAMMVFVEMRSDPTDKNSIDNKTDNVPIVFVPGTMGCWETKEFDNIVNCIKENISSITDHIKDIESEIRGHKITDKILKAELEFGILNLNKLQDCFNENIVNKTKTKNYYNTQIKDKNCSLIGTYYIEPLMDSYVDFFEALEQNGYKQNRDYFIYGYDTFRDDIENVSGKKLAEYVEYVLKVTKAKKIKLIAHSQGNLVARTYIELLGGHEKVETFIMVAPPNRGVDVMDDLYYNGKDPLSKWNTGFSSWIRELMIKFFTWWSPKDNGGIEKSVPIYKFYKVTNKQMSTLLQTSGNAVKGMLTRDALLEKLNELPNAYKLTEIPNLVIIRAKNVADKKNTVIGHNGDYSVDNNGLVNIGKPDLGEGDGTVAFASNLIPGLIFKVKTFSSLEDIHQGLFKNNNKNGLSSMVKTSVIRNDLYGAHLKYEIKGLNCYTHILYELNIYGWKDANEKKELEKYDN